MKYLKKLREEKGDIAAMQQFVTLGIFILIGVIVYANIFVAGAQSTTTNETVNATFGGLNFSTVLTNSPIYAGTDTVTADGLILADNGGNYSLVDANGGITIYNTSTTFGTEILITYIYSTTRDATAKTTVDALNTTWYNSVQLLIIVFLVIAAVVILAYVRRLGGPGQ